jgi:hypothetical protein
VLQDQGEGVSSCIEAAQTAIKMVKGDLVRPGISNVQR